MAITMNGGVSLAVYMGGAAHESNELTRPSSNYQPLLRLLGHDRLPVVDVLAGTSAGGINAAALALAQVNDEGADLSVMKTLWVEDGQIGSLLRPPFRAGSPSLLQGDTYFLPTILSSLRQLTNGFKRDISSARAVDLTITATLLTPVNLRTADDLGTGLVQPQHAGLFRFRTHDSTSAATTVAVAGGGSPQSAPSAVNEDVFAEDRIDKTVEAIALASRASAGFPVAFEPTFIPIRDRPQPDRPDMAEFADWAKSESKEPTLSRFAVDGGVLANTPTRPTLEAIRARAAADRPVRRVLILQHPHATSASSVRPQSDLVTEPPLSLVVSLAGVLGASSSVGSRSYVEDIESYNEHALRWRDGRVIVMANFPTADKLEMFLWDGKSPRTAAPRAVCRHRRSS